MSRILTRKFIFSHNTTMMSALQLMARTQNEVLNQHGWIGRRVMGYKLPVWQRPEAWDDDQCVRFIESVWLGVGLGTFLVNSCPSKPAVDLMLLDGQQRLRAIERYLADELAVRGEDGDEYFWGELTPDEKAQFLRIPMGWQECRYTTDAELRDAYNRHNFGGTQHLPSQRA